MNRSVLLTDIRIVELSDSTLLTNSGPQTPKLRDNSVDTFRRRDVGLVVHSRVEVFFFQVRRFTLFDVRKTRPFLERRSRGPVIFFIYQDINMEKDKRVYS